MTTLPSVFTPEQVAKHVGWSARKLREFASGLGTCRILGNRMVLTQQDVDAIMEASRPCPSLSTVAATSGTTAVRLPETDYEALRALRTKKQPSASQPTGKRKSGKVILMARTQS